ncbi:MAG TPA: DinB family protein [Bryobacteraceae bacterium]|jgi:uncharacterized damage-inducible protein DinB|nr:DinB family protein [Bryobacteraceae bacterium]
MLISQLEQINRKIAALADEFPKEKYEWKPADGLRTFGDVLRHLAFWNQYVADSASGRKTEEAANELPIADYSTKAQINLAFQKTAVAAAAALRQHSDGLELKMAELVVTFTAHNSEHYGQLAVYTRLNGIVPPASRAQ